MKNFIIFSSMFLLKVGLIVGILMDDQDALSIRISQLEINHIQAVLNNTILLNKVRQLEDEMAECGCQTSKPAHPAFMAKFGSPLVTCANNQTLVFDSVDLDSGSPYSPVQGVFTAPVSGNYAFNVALSTAPGNRFHIVLVKNDPENIIGYLFSDEANAWEKDSTSVVTHLDQADTVWVKCADNSTLVGNADHWNGGIGDYHSHFSGFMISTD